MGLGAGLLGVLSPHDIRLLKSQHLTAESPSGTCTDTMRYILKGDQFEGQEALHVSPADWEQSSNKTLLSQTMRKTEDLVGNKVRRRERKGFEQKGTAG